MKSLLLILILFIITNVKAQGISPERKYIPITLNDTGIEGKIIAVTVQDKVILYFRESGIKKLARQYKYSLLLGLFDSAFLKSDTVKFNINSSIDGDSLATQLHTLLHSELIRGYAKAYLKKEQVWSQIIYYYLDEGELTTMIYYSLPDKRLFHFSLYSIHNAGRISTRAKGE